MNDNLKKIGSKNTSPKKIVFSNENDDLQKQNEDLKNKNDSLKPKVKCLEKDNDVLQNEIISFKEKPSILLEHKNSPDDITNAIKYLEKMNNSLNEIILRFTNGEEFEKVTWFSKVFF